MATLPISFNFDNLAVGTDIENLNGWTTVDQGAGATSTVQTYPTGKSGYSGGRNSGRNVTTGGLWCYFGTTDTTYTDVDWRGTYTNNTTAGSLAVRSQNNSFFPNSYGIRFSGGTTIEIIKTCGVNSYVMSSHSITHSLSNGIVFRLMMIGLVLYAWVDNNYVGSYDFTGNALCGSATFNSGGMGCWTFSATQYITTSSIIPVAGGGFL